jgi:hypothetical protein
MTSTLNRRLRKLGQTLNEIRRKPDERAGRDRPRVERTDEELRELGRQMSAKLRAVGLCDRGSSR